MNISWRPERIQSRINNMEWNRNGNVFNMFNTDANNNKNGSINSLVFLAVHRQWQRSPPSQRNGTSKMMEFLSKIHFPIYTRESCELLMKAFARAFRFYLFRPTAWNQSHNFNCVSNARGQRKASNVCVCVSVCTGIVQYIRTRTIPRRHRTQHPQSL